jgi:hypothetical protein
MIRFRCLHCDKTLKVPETKVVATVVCPRCKERSVVPTAALAGALGEQIDCEGQPEEPSRMTAGHEDQALSLFAGMSLGLRWSVALVAAVGVFGFVLAVVAPLVPALARVADGAAQWATVLVPSSVVVLLVILYGHGTGCPSCNRWWTRTKVETEFVNREVFAKDGVPFARSTYRTTYECSACGHKWWTTSTDEYKDFVRHTPKKRLG